MDEINQEERAALAWEVLIRIATENEVIRYRQLGDEIGIHHRAIRYVLAIIQDYCLNHELPPITILVGDASGLPGSGFIAWDAENLQEGFHQVYGFNWYNLENPFSYALTGETQDDVVNELLNDPNNSAATYAKIKVRGTAQSIFRKALLKTYESKCAFCGLSFPPALQAAHIILWTKSTKSQRLDVRNGLLLCATHHCLFDAGVLTINNEYILSFVGDQRRAIGDSDQFVAFALHNQIANLPRNRKHWPNPEYILERLAIA